MDRTVARGSDIPTASLKAARGARTLRVTNVDQAQAQEAIDRARADGEALVHAEADRDQAREQAEQYRPATQAADQRTAAAEARAEDARAETARAELARLRQ